MTTCFQLCNVGSTKVPSSNIYKEKTSECYNLALMADLGSFVQMKLLGITYGNVSIQWEIMDSEMDASSL